MSSVKRNFGYEIAYQILAFAVPLVTAPYLSRVLGASGIGEYSFGYNIAYYLGLLAQLGLSRYGTREIAAHREEKRDAERLFWELYWLQGGLTLLVLIGYVTYILLQPNNALAPLWIPYLLSYGFDLTWLYNGEENFKITVTRNSVVKLIMLSGVLLLVKSPEDVWVYVCIASIGQLIAQLVAVPYAKRYISKIQPPSIKRSFSHLLPSLMLFVPTIATSIYRTMDKIMLGAVCPSEQLGYFDSSEKIIMIPLGVISALSAVMLPKIALLLAQDKRDTGVAYIQSTMLISNIMSFGMCGGIISVAADFVPLYFGPSFAPCVGLIQMLAITVPFIAWACVVREQYLIPAARNREYLTSVASGAICNVILNLLLMPSLGATGTGISMIVTEILVCALLSRSVFEELNLKRSLISALPFGCAALAMIMVSAFFSSLVPSGILSLAVRFVSAAIVYLMASFAICKVNKSIHPELKILFGSKLCGLFGIN